MTLSVAEIAFVVADLRANVLPATVRRVFSADPAPSADGPEPPGPRPAAERSDPGFVVELRSRGTTRWLAVSLHPSLCRMHLLGARPGRRADRGVAGFVRTAHATLAGLATVGIEQEPDDRAVRLLLEGWSIAVELTGRHANAFLIDGGGIIRSSYRPSASRKRSLLWGDPYEPPIPRPGAPWIDAPSRFPADRIHESIERAYADLSARAASEAALAEAGRRARSEVARLERLVANLRRERAEAAEAGTWRRRGELLKPVAASLAAGARSVRVVDWFDPAMGAIDVPLDPALDGPGNLVRCFSTARRLSKRPAVLGPRLAEAERRLAGARAALSAAAAGSPVRGLARAAPRETAGAGDRARSGGERRPFRLFLSGDGHEILVGRSARDNDRLTFQIARGHDAWLHAAGAAGSHVVVRLPKGREPTETSVADAAMLALHYSKLGRGGEGEVYVTRRKHVRRVRGGSPGQVVVAQERRVFVRIDPGRLAALLRSPA